LLSFLTVGINANGGKVTPVFVDTGGKLTAGVVDTDGNVDLRIDVTAGMDDTAGHFAAGVVVTCYNPLTKSKTSLPCPFNMLFYVYDTSCPSSPTQYTPYFISLF
jgi:hypothetical protein